MADSEASNGSGTVGINDQVLGNELEVSESKSSDDMLAQIRALFGDEVASAFEREEIITEEAIKDCIARDADAPIFGRLGLTYGKAVRFKATFEKIFPQDNFVRAKKRSTPSPTNVKPSMGDIAFFSPEQKALYLTKRKKVGLLAADYWKATTTTCPKFNTPQMKADLANFAKQIAPQCAMPEVGFNVDGIMKHVQSFFNEQRRYRNRKPVSIKVEDLTSEIPKLPELITESSDRQKRKSSGNESTNSTARKHHKKDKTGDDDCSEDSLTDQSSTSTNPSTVSLSDHDGDSVGEDAGDHEMSSSQPKSVLSQSATNYTLKASQMIYKAILGIQPNREDILKILKKKFNVKQDQLTLLTMTQLLEVIAKKLVNNKYCTIKEGINMNSIRMENITVHKEIAL